MNKKVKRILILLILIIIIIGVVYFFARNNEEEINIENNQEMVPPVQNIIEEEFVEVLDNGIKMNTSAKLKEKKTVNGLEIDDIQFFMSNGQTYLKANVTNKSGKDFEIKGVDVILYDKEGNEITRMGGIIEDLKNGETKEFGCTTTLDFANAYDFKIEM